MHSTDNATRIHYIGLRMRAAALRRDGDIQTALHLEGEAEGLVAYAAEHDYDAEAWETIEAEADDLAAIGDSTGQDWSELLDRAFTL